jgi:hypothetical protein
MFWKPKEEGESPIDVVLSSFTRNAASINTVLGFPGVLLLFSVLALSLPAIPGVAVSNGFFLVSGGAILASAISYAAQWFYSAKQAEAQASILRSFTQSFLDRYLAGKQVFEAEHVDWAIRNILLPLTKEPKS